MKLGVALPLTDVGGDPTTVRDFAQAAEGLGYDYLAGTDHVLGVNAASRPDWGNRNTSADFFHDPFVLFGFLSACTSRIEFSTEVLILAQRQTVLVAKQTACLDILSGGRFRLGIGIGWNPVEFIGLNEDFGNRGRRSEEQVQVMQALWAERHVSFKGRWHTVDDAGINPLPLTRRVPLWYGGHNEATLQRIAKWGDGWIMLAHPQGDAARAEIAKLHAYAEAAGRKKEAVGLSVWVSAVGDEASWRKEIEAWKEAGVTHVTLNNTFGRYYHRRIPGRSMSDHMTAIKRYQQAVADLVS
jgi:probable F420-dependent oxidoreductase